MAIFNKIEKFNGEEDLECWFRKFNRCCNLAQKDDDVVKGQLLMMCLSGQALAIAEQLEVDRAGDITYAQIKRRLESVFDTVASR